MTERQIKIHGIRIVKTEAHYFWQVVDYLEKHFHDVKIAICETMIRRFVCYAIDKSYIGYEKELALSLSAISGWAEIIRKCCGLDVQSYINTFDFKKDVILSSEKSTIDGELISEKILLEKIFSYIEEYSIRNITDVIIETVCTRYLPLALSREDSRLKLVAEENATTCDIWATEIRMYAGLSFPIPISPAPMNMMPYSNMQQVQATLPPVETEESVVDNPKNDEVEQNDENVTSQEPEPKKRKLPELSWGSDSDWTGV